MSPKPAAPKDSLNVPRFVGVPTFMRLPLSDRAEGLDAAILGLPSDSGAPFRTGARMGPNAVRQASIMLRPFNPYRGNIDIFEALKIADLGDAPVVPGYEMETLVWLEEAVDRVVSAGAVPCCIGGDHSVTLAELRAVAKRHGPLALVHFDSHTDTWDTYFAERRYSAGTPFLRAVEEGIVDPARSIQIGMRGSLFRASDITQSLDLGYDVVTTDEIFTIGFAALANRIAMRTAGAPVFLTFDMDFVDPSAAPAVETPEAGGPTARETLALLRAIGGLDIKGCDVVEITPTYEGPGQITSLLGATVMAEILAMIAQYRQG
ncbi:agmatinase [Antarcticimicrobium sediminis]|uniref:Agmatinase n=1 Tax=Antarcticimicrobium sediminis TaxID=2546227 RepID=A0A4R5EUS0_9RHOB|nr:agmatinase [Antarcticimicrobium sediminis]TDE38467.1 agmatinase [Antarcticimicrobium sediminis]